MMSYLYGELEPAGQKKVEEYLQENPEEKKRIEEWSFARSVFSGLEDKEVIAPSIAFVDEKKIIPFWKENYFRMPMGIAASLLIFLVSAKLIGLSIAYSPGELKIAFGDRVEKIEKTQPVQQASALTEKQVEEMIQATLASNNENLKTSWTEDRKVLEKAIQRNLNSNSSKIDNLMKTASLANQEQVKQFVGQMQNDNLKLMKDYMQLSVTGQKEYIETLLVDFSKYLQEQRKQDLQVFQARVNKVEQNTDIFKQETEQILTSLISTVRPDNSKKKLKMKSMKQMRIMTICAVAMVTSFMALGQDKAPDSRMEQDIAVAENILSTLMQQQYGRRAFFPTEVKGSYTAGYGITFRMPQNGLLNGGYLYKTWDANPGQMEIFTPGGTFTYSVTEGDESGDEIQNAKTAKVRTQQGRGTGQRVVTGTGKSTAVAPKAPKTPPSPVSDSLAASASERFLEVSKNFLADYGDILSQLKPEEKIIITNRGDEFGGGLVFNGFGYGNGYTSTGWEAKRSMISVESKRDDITQLKQGKITRDQFLKKLTIVNSESSDKLDPDLEVLSSMFNRLYREDLSKTYYTQGNVGYERLKDFGVIYYMRVYSSVEQGNDLFTIPTISVENVSQEERDKKVKELYPEFEQGLKDNLIEYGRTLRSLKDDELVTINVKLTKCVGCGIPGALEISVKNSVLKDYSSGKITKEAAFAKVNVKKSGAQ